MAYLRNMLVPFFAVLLGAIGAQAQEHREVHVGTRMGSEDSSQIMVYTEGDTIYVIRGKQGAIVYFEDNTVVVEPKPVEELMTFMPPLERIERVEVFRHVPEENQVWVEKGEDRAFDELVRGLTEWAGRWQHVIDGYQKRMKEHHGGEPVWMQPTPEEVRVLKELHEQIRKLERESMRLARRIRRGEVNDTRKAEKELEELLGRIFDLKQKVLETRIQQLQERLRMRNRERKAIIERRKQQLLGGHVIYAW